MRKILTVVLLAVIAVMLIITVLEMPAIGDPANPTFNEIPQRYLEQGYEETGAVNMIASVITDYRAFDTIGEATVLFVAIAAAIANLKAH
ncbi:hydrogen gas-evolving membrane-bound hydrogenase subunit E [Dethiobacter alkaliphilus]|uniref:hydrogen gas-evolving membrane-bound hydrogenase subunit E n=1 Tax=Dethiobacter alkaliphilus TaxID=427926 RepID=UPI002227CB85|nr:hydrogen gas-evolving membrane-bound hydrogenase subunit E [Dethiobacter alkaliphilus]MCW3491363.1 hypothetical protein [Dethiobacter alkaliphilus]